MSLLNAPTYRFTVEEYEQLGRDGFFGNSKRIELLNGQIVVLSPIGYRHATAVTRPAPLAFSDLVVRVGDFLP